MYRSRIGKFIFVLISLACLLSCTKEGKVVYVISDEEDSYVGNLVYFVTRQGTLGDVGYMDDMYRGVVRGTQGCGMMLSLVEIPSDTAKVVSTIEYMLDYMSSEETARRALVILANDGLEPLLHEYEHLLTRASNVDFLLVETTDLTLPIYTLRIPQYGIYYQAGRLVADALPDVTDVLCVSANPSAPELGDMYGGFAAGLSDGNPQIGIDNVYLSDGSGGYDQALDAYKMSYGLEKQYGLVLPLCGGSAQGFFRYNRENSHSFYTVGVDCDMQQYSSKVPFSVVKHIGDALEDWIFRWWDEKEQIPSHEDLGLESGYPEIVISDAFADSLEGIADKYYDQALEEERKYESR